MIIGHSNCEKGYKVYNISDSDHNQFESRFYHDAGAINIVEIC